jgi:hypothetical protein
MSQTEFFGLKPLARVGAAQAGRHCTDSRRITVVAVSVFPPRYIGDGSQLTSLKGMETVTVTGSPNSAVLGGLGETVVGSALGVIDPLARYSFTTAFTSAVVAPSSTAFRAPSREALVITCWTMTMRPYSIMPNTSRKNTGATTANSTAAAPRRFLRYDRQDRCNLSLAGGKDALKPATCRQTASKPVTASRQVRAFM